jgi:hypothetical protein
LSQCNHRATRDERGIEDLEVDGRAAASRHGGGAGRYLGPRRLSERVKER